MDLFNEDTTSDNPFGWTEKILPGLTKGQKYHVKTNAGYWVGVEYCGRGDTEHPDSGDKISGHRFKDIDKPNAKCNEWWSEQSLQHKITNDLIRPYRPDWSIMDDIQFGTLNDIQGRNFVIYFEGGIELEKTTKLQKKLFDMGFHFPKRGDKFKPVTSEDSDGKRVIMFECYNWDTTNERYGQMPPNMRDEGVMILVADNPDNYFPSDKELTLQYTFSTVIDHDAIVVNGLDYLDSKLTENFDWANEISSDPLKWNPGDVTYDNVERDDDGYAVTTGQGEGEIYVDVDGLTVKQKREVLNNINKYLNGKLRFDNKREWCEGNRIKGFLIHCGHEDYDYFSQENHICCLEDSYTEFTEGEDRIATPLVNGKIFLDNKTITEEFFYKGVNPTVDLVVIRGDKVLLIKRSEDSEVEPGMWALPGGFQDTEAKKGEEWLPGKETSLEAAKREVMEETGLNFDEIEGLNFELVGKFDGNDEEDGSWSETTVYKVHIPEHEGDGVEVTDETERVEWVPLSLVLDRKLAFNHHKIIERALTMGEINENFDWAGDVRIGSGTINELLSGCRDVPVSPFNLREKSFYTRRGKPMVMYLSKCPYWWDRFKDLPVDERGVGTGGWFKDEDNGKHKVANIMPDFVDGDTKVDNIRDIDNDELSAITYTDRLVEAYLNINNSGEMWILLDENLKPMYELVHHSIIDDVKKSFGEETGYEINEDVTGFEWAEEDNKYVPKVGDVVRCVPGYHNDRSVLNDNDWDSKEKVLNSGYGGAGYKEGYEFEVGEVYKLNDYDFYVVFPKVRGRGVYNWAIEPVMLKEGTGFEWMEKANKYTPRVGDIVRCLPGYHNDRSVLGVDDWDSEEKILNSGYAGVGYKEGYEFEVGSYTDFKNLDTNIIFPKDRDRGIFDWAIEPVMLKEGTGFEWSDEIPGEIDIELWERITDAIDNVVSGPHSGNLRTQFSELADILGQYRIDIDEMSNFFMYPPDGPKDRNGDDITNFELRELADDLIQNGYMLSDEDEEELGLMENNETGFEWTGEIKAEEFRFFEIAVCNEYDEDAECVDATSYYIKVPIDYIGMKEDGVGFNDTKILDWSIQKEIINKRNVSDVNYVEEVDKTIYCRYEGDYNEEDIQLCHRLNVRESEEDITGFEWTSDIPSNVYRYFLIDFCYSGEYDEYGDEYCDESGSHYIKIPVEVVPELWDQDGIGYGLTPDEGGQKIIDWSIKNGVITDTDVVWFDYVIEIEEGEYCRNSGDIEFCDGVTLSESEDTGFEWVNDSPTINVGDVFHVPRSNSIPTKLDDNTFEVYDISPNREWVRTSHHDTRGIGVNGNAYLPIDKINRETLSKDWDKSGYNDANSTKFEQVFKNINRGYWVRLGIPGYLTTNPSEVKKIIKLGSNKITEDTGFEWVPELPNVPQPDTSWVIRGIKSQDDRINVQKFLFNLGFSWPGEEPYSVDYELDFTVLSSVFDDNIMNQQFTYGRDFNLNLYKDMVHQYSGLDQFYLFTWDGEKTILDDVIKLSNLNENQTGFEWTGDIEPTDYRFFEVYVCHSGSYDEETGEDECETSGVYHIKIPTHIVTDIWDYYEGYYGGPGDDGQEVINWSIKNGFIDDADVHWYEAVMEVPEERYCVDWGMLNPENESNVFCEKYKKSDYYG